MVAKAPRREAALARFWSLCHELTPVAHDLRVRDLSFWYGAVQALDGISLEIPAAAITALIGPSGCGKSTLLRCFNRMYEEVPGTRVAGKIELGGLNVLDPRLDVHTLRRRVGMVFQRPNPFPKSVYENVAFGPRIHGYRGGLDELVEANLRAAALWEEVKDRLHESALRLSGGQQQRLCIARALAIEPDVVLFDEPCSALDPVATAKVEELMTELRGSYTQVVVTHNMQQASRVSDQTAFFYLGRLVEVGETGALFVNPREPRTQDYISGRFG